MTEQLIKVHGRGNRQIPEFLILGEAPGKTEVLEGKPFVGRSGKILKEWLIEAKVTDYYIDNVVPFMPLDRNGKIRRPTSDELEKFRPSLNTTIEQIKPKSIITLGQSAIDSLLQLNVKDVLHSINIYRGIPLAAIYHPMGYVYMKDGRVKGKQDFVDAVELLRRTRA